MMWPLLLCSILLGGVLIERVWTLGVSRHLRGRHMEPAQLRAHRRVLVFFTDVPPSLGLLGTVIGVVQSFQLVQGRLNGDAVGAGLGTACLTTIFGLGIGVVASIAGYLFDWWTHPSSVPAEGESKQKVAAR